MALFRKRPKPVEKEAWAGAEPMGPEYDHEPLPISSNVEDNSNKLILSKLDLIEAKLKNIEERLVTIEKVKQILDQILEANEQPEKKW